MIVSVRLFVDRETTRKVLIIEDTIELTEITQAALQRVGLRAFYDVLGARTVERYFDVSPDIVLLDLRPPELVSSGLLCK